MSRPQRQFEATVRSGEALAVIDLHGEMDGFAEEALNAAYAKATRHGPPAILLNFSDVDYINSTGIALIVGLLAQARKSHRRLLTCGLSEHYQEIFRITRLADFMRMVPDERAALDEIEAA
jgi:anti-sigma B factor antagonist